MKAIFKFLALFLCVLMATCNMNQESSSYRVMTFNIRYDNPGDSNNSWQNRKEYLTECLQEISPDLIGMQEVLERQLIYLDENLAGYDHVGVGREDAW